MGEAYPFNDHEEIHFEVGELVPGGGTFSLVTALHWEGWRSGSIRESHVFLHGPGLHLHEIEYAVADDQRVSLIAERACEATRTLLFAHLRQSGALKSGVQRRWMEIGLRPTLETPFPRLKLLGTFTSVLQSIEDWTTSRLLRTELRQLTGRLHAGHVERHDSAGFGRN